MIERHQDYTLPITEMVNGAILSPLQIGTDTDAPFVLRAVGGYYITDAGGIGEAVANLPALLRVRIGDSDNNWLQTGRVPGLVAQTVGTDYIPLRRHVAYPARGVIRVQVENVSGGTLNGIVLVFRGVKLFPGSGVSAPVYAPTYPACYTQETFQYTVNFDLAAGTQQLDVPININDDADFVWRGTLIETDATIASNSAQVLEVRVKDWTQKYYSGDGTGGGIGAWIRAPRLFAETTTYAPGLWYPELYIPRGRQFYMDLRNVGVGLRSAGQICLEGAKIFTR